MTGRLVLAREQILAFRWAAGALEARLPPGAASIARAARAGLQDSMPRAALLSLHARVAGTRADALEDPSLEQVWGPRFSVYVVAAADRAPFTLGRLPDDTAGLRRATQMADRLESFLGARRMAFGEAGRGVGVPHNALRYAAPTGRVLLRWDGARQPTVWMVPAPDVDPREARLDLARRYLHTFGPATPGSFAQWAGIRPPRAAATFQALADELVPVRTPVGEAWILAADEAAFRAPAGPAAAARLLPSGDAYFLLWGSDRAVLVPDDSRRGELWTSRVWPGAVVLDREVAGTWRRAGADVTVRPWRPLSRAERAAVELEAASLPLPGIGRSIVVRWEA